MYIEQILEEVSLAISSIAWLFIWIGSAVFAFFMVIGAYAQNLRDLTPEEIESLQENRFTEWPRQIELVFCHRCGRYGCVCRD